MLIAFNSALCGLLTLIFNAVKRLMPMFISKKKKDEDAAGQLSCSAVL